MKMRPAIALLLLAFFNGSGYTHQRIFILPIGPVPADVLSQLQQDLPGTMHADVAVGSEIALPPEALHAKRRQYLGSALLAQLAAHDNPAADRVLGIIDADAYAPGLNFIFGQATKPGRFAVVALPRLHGPRFRERLVKISIHELGHSFGYAHCDTDRCVMAFANSLGDVDRQTARFCGREPPR